MKLLLYRVYQFAVMAPLLLVCTTITCVIVIVGTLLGLGRPIGYYVPHIWARIFCILSLVKVEVRGGNDMQKGQSYVFVANHQGAYDIFAIYGYLGHNFRWMMKKSLGKIPLVGYTCKVSGHIFVDNSSPKAVKETMENAEKQLSGGMSVVVFPEGSRSRNGRLQRFKRGAYMLATEFNLPVVPITIDGAYDVMPRTAVLPHWGKIILTIHKPIEASGNGHNLAELMDKSREAIASSLPERSK